MTRAKSTLIILTLINLLNYTDRFILAGVMVQVMSAFSLSGVEGGLLSSVFMIVYLIASPIGGYFGDRRSRPRLISVSVLIWSIATIGSALASNFTLLLLARAATGFGEAGFGAVAPALLADRYRPEDRGRAFAIFYAAIPLGAGLGFVLGGVIGEAMGWQAAFFIGGLPGLVAGLFAWWIEDPPRGAVDREAPINMTFGAGLRSLASNRTFWTLTASLTLMTFSIGGLSNWMPTFLEKERGFSASAAGLALGATTVVAGFGGTIVGGWLGDFFDRKRAHGSLLLSAAGLVAAAPLMLLASKQLGPTLLIASLIAAQFLIFLNNGPLNAAIVNVVPSSMRAFAFSVSTVTLHLLGDAMSPTVIGWVSDRSSLAVALRLNALPVLLSGLVLLVAASQLTKLTAALKR